MNPSVIDKSMFSYVKIKIGWKKLLELNNTGYT